MRDNTHRTAHHAPTRESGIVPGIAELNISPGPRDDPLTYPGETPDTSYLLLDSWMYGLQPIPGRVVGQWRVDVDGGPLTGLGVAAGLDEGLAFAAAAPLAARHPVLAFGSNAAPAQLLDKFAGLTGPGLVVPVTRATVQGFSLGHSPHVSNPGYVPFVVVNSARRNKLEVNMLWLDSDQLTCLNATEPNYRLVPTPGERYPLTLQSRQTITNYSLYKGRWGALKWADEPLPTAAGSQLEVFAGLNAMRWFRVLVGDGDVRSQMSRLRADLTLRDRVRSELFDRGLVVPDGWGDS
jgi:hypothetical protein